MTAPTQPVTCRFFDQDGLPIAARVSFKLTVQEIYNGIVVGPQPDYVTCDAATGIGVINLFPNALGANSSQYIVKAVDSVTGRKVLAETLCTVPNSPCYLDLILNQVPFPTIDAAGVALAAAQGALALATAQADIATAKAILTAADRVQTGLEAGIATTKAGEADVSAAAALESLNQIKSRYYGALASDPALNPLGAAVDVGDEYFNTATNLVKRYNGATWQASDINTANLAAPTGSSLSGYRHSGTGAVATTVQAKLRESVSVKDFGAVGDGVTNDTAAFTDAGSAGVTTVVVPAGTYNLVTTPVATTDVTWRIEKGAYFNGANALVSTNNVTGFGNYTGVTGVRTASWMGNGTVITDPTPALAYMEKNATFGAYASTGSIGIVGAARTSQMTSGAAIGLSGVGFNDNATNSVNAWGLYVDAKTTATALGGVFGIEVGVATLGAYQDAYAVTNNKQTGIAIAAGADSSINGTTDSVTWAMRIFNNGATFGRGISFSSSALRNHTDAGGVTHQKAIVLRSGNQIGYEDVAGDGLGFFRSRVNATASESAVDLSNNTVDLLGYQNAPIGKFFHTASAVNYFQFNNAVATASPALYSVGSDTNIDIRLIPKGTGVLRFGTWTTSADVAVNGYITIKDSAGTVRKIATIA